MTLHATLITTTGAAVGAGMACGGSGMAVGAICGAGGAEYTSGVTVASIRACGVFVGCTAGTLSPASFSKSSRLVPSPPPLHAVSSSTAINPAINLSLILHLVLNLT
jgi:hypothetical protein